MIDDALSKRILIYASVSGALGILIGAFGTHYLPTFLESRGLDSELIAKRVGQFDVGARYHLIHSAVLLALSSVPYGSPASRRWTARMFVLGTIIFSGSLYALAISNFPKLGIITPIGGLTWIAAWLMIIWIVMHGRKREKKFAQIRGHQL